MKSKYLFPTSFRTLGFALALPGFILGYLGLYQNFSIKALDFEISYRNLFQEIAQLQTQNFTDEFALTLVISGLLFIAFSRLKHEDELTARLRLDALYWAILINSIIYFILLILNITLWINHNDVSFSWSFYDVPLYNMFTPLLIFIIRFNYLINYKKEAYLIPRSHYLPHYPFRSVGKWLSILVFVILIMDRFEFDFMKTVSEWISPSSPILHASLLIWAYSKNANEDELTTQFRLESMQLSVYLNYALLMLANLVVFGTNFLTVMQINLLTPVLFFVLIFSYVCNKNYSQVRRDIKGGLLS